MNDLKHARVIHSMSVHTNERHLVLDELKMNLIKSYMAKSPRFKFQWTVFKSVHIFYTKC